MFLYQAGYNKMTWKPADRKTTNLVLQGQSMSQFSLCSFLMFVEKNPVSQRQDCLEYNMAPGQPLSVKGKDLNNKLIHWILGLRQAL